MPKTMTVDWGGAPPDLGIRQKLAEACPDYEIVDGPVRACETCGFFECVCETRRVHKDGCRFRKAMECPVGIHCDEHGYDVCPTCDPCTCAQC